jgi:hypothetical protein
MLKRILTATALTAAFLPGVAQAKSHAVHYRGKTSGGSKVTFKLDKSWIRGFETKAPTTCGSAQGGNPKATAGWYQPPFDFKVGYKIKYKDTTGITTHYNITTHRRAHKKIVGTFESNWSLLTSDGWGGYRILICEQKSSFTAKPTRK